LRRQPRHRRSIALALRGGRREGFHLRARRRGSRGDADGDRGDGRDGHAEVCDLASEEAIARYIPKPRRRSAASTCS
jgi:hypothetical protein